MAIDLCNEFVTYYDYLYDIDTFNNAEVSKHSVYELTLAYDLGQLFINISNQLEEKYYQLAFEEERWD